MRQQFSDPARATPLVLQLHLVRVASCNNHDRMVPRPVFLTCCYNLAGTKSVATFVRRFLCIFLLMLLPLQGVASQSGWLAPGGAFDIAHEIEHLNGTSHHHGDDGTIHYDESGESAKHFADHCAGAQQTAAIPSLEPLHVALSLLGLVHHNWRRYIPDPVLEQPQRPPQALG